MGRELQIPVAALNIVLQPHTPQKYVDLLLMLLRLKSPIHSRGTQHLMIGELSRVDKDNPLEGLTGRIYRFDQIDPDAPWFNVENHEEASPEEMAAVHIPDSLKPNLVTFDFVFYPRGHTLYVQTKSKGYDLSPSSVKKMLSVLCERKAVVGQFGVAEITVLPDREQLEKILSLHRLAKLTIDVTRPNPDDLGDEEDRVWERFDRMGIRRVVEVLSAEPGESIKPDAEIAMMARVAANNGKVTGVGYTAAGERVEESTVNRPWRDVVYYDRDTQTPLNALIENTREKHANG